MTAPSRAGPRSGVPSSSEAIVRGEGMPMSERRAEGARAFEAPDFDVVIIGGGINGLATFRDLALQGVRVLLVERGDFLSGASSASSHMIHCGIRYLEHGE